MNFNLDFNLNEKRRFNVCGNSCQLIEHLAQLALTFMLLKDMGLKQNSNLELILELLVLAVQLC